MHIERGVNRKCCNKRRIGRTPPSVGCQEELQQTVAVTGNFQFVVFLPDFFHLLFS